MLRDRRLAASVAAGTSLMYESTALLFHLPSNLMSSLDIPFPAADTAAPLRNEWPEYP